MVRHRRRLPSSALLLSAVALGGCATGPRYVKPTTPVPPTWTVEAPWQQASPKDALPKGPWWTIYGDDELTGYETQALANNQSIQGAVARLEQARDLARVQTAGFFPSATADPLVQRQRLSGNRPAVGSTAAATAVTQGNFELPFQVNYEADIFGRVRHNVEAANAQYQAAGADLENVRLLMTSDLAADYFTLRELDSEIAVIDEAVALDQRGLQLVENRHAGGIASGLDVAQQETVLDAAVAQLHLLRQQRANYEHAIAVLLGTPAPTFHVAARKLTGSVPPVPPGLPADVLERRPDIAEAERQVATENALIGVARSAFYPDVLLSAGGGLQAADITRLFNLSSTFWSLGASAAETIFAGGRLHAQLDYQKAAYDNAVANYRNTVLTAFQQVEDGLTGLATLADAQAAQEKAVADAQRYLTIANDRYVGGVVTYLDVITAQQTLLSNQRLATQILGQRLVTSVYLVKALGGGWDRSTLDALQVRANPKQVVQQ
jgi:multidrug efflux system outer membrane protein